MAASRAKRKDGKGDEDFEHSILARLTKEYEQHAFSEESANDVAILFCGSKKSGKTSLVDRFINPTKDEKDIPKPTVALDYKFARYAAEGSTSKTLAHIYDLGGDDNNDELVAIPVSPATVSNLVLALIVDLSEPWTVLPTLDKWLPLLRQQSVKALQSLASESDAGARRVEASQARRQELFAAHPDASALNIFPVQLVIFGAKWDAFATGYDPEKRKVLCMALRHFAHVNGASLLFSSVGDKTAMNNVRGLLRQLLFGATVKGGLPEQLDAAKPLCTLAGRDSLLAIGAPLGGSSNEQAWRQMVNQLFHDPTLMSKDGKKSESAQVSEELLKFPESSIDGMVEQRLEELVQYRRQVERNQRLASEGITAPGTFKD